MWQEYVEGKQTYIQLATKYNCSLKTIQRRLDKVRVGIHRQNPREVVVLMDTTYFGRTFGVMLFKDAYTGLNLFKQFVKYETNELYHIGIQYLKEQGYIIKAIVCDGRKGLLKHFEETPVQMCQFHQVAIITRYLTRNPKLQASKELRELCLILTKTDKESFEGGLNQWYDKWKLFLNERSKDSITGKSHYIHKRLRAAYRSLSYNLKWLFTWYDNYELNIPNTTNAIDGHFADLKNKLRNHNGLNQKHKEKFINEFLKA